MSWAAAAAVIVACVVPFLVDWFGPPVTERTSAAINVAFLSPELEGESKDRSLPASSFGRAAGDFDGDGRVDVLVTGLSGDRLNLVSAGTAPDSLEELTVTAEVPALGSTVISESISESMRVQPSSSPVKLWL